MALTSEEKNRAVARLKMCKLNLSKAKFDVAFWNKELIAVVEELATDKQFNFDEIFTKGDLNESV